MKDQVKFFSSQKTGKVFRGKGNAVIFQTTEVNGDQFSKCRKMRNKTLEAFCGQKKLLPTNRWHKGGCATQNSSLLRAQRQSVCGKHSHANIHKLAQHNHD